MVNHLPGGDMKRFLTYHNGARCPELLDAMSEVESRGYRASENSWQDGERVCAYSIESSGPATLGQPRITICLARKGVS